jgi:adenylylsulfate reductase subunit B
MVLDEATNKGINQEPEMCSECYACVKLCPQEALHVRGYADFVPMGAAVMPHRTEDGLRWEVRFRDGRTFEFTYQSRTKPAGSVVLYEGFTEDRQNDAKNQSLAGDSLWLGVDKLPTPN